MSQHPNMKSFLEFCEKKDPNEHYIYTLTDECAMAQYIGVALYNDMLTNNTIRFREFDMMEHLACRGSHTFGALAGRLRMQLAGAKMGE